MFGTQQVFNHDRKNERVEEEREAVMQTEGTVHVNEWTWDRMGLSGTKSVGGATR